MPRPKIIDRLFEFRYEFEIAPLATKANNPAEGRLGVPEVLKAQERLKRNFDIASDYGNYIIA